MIDTLLVLGGIALLYGGGELLVRYAAGLGRVLGMSPLVVGLTIVSFGTSAPELASTLSATLKGATDVAIGNIIGSNIANVGLVVGLVALLRPLPSGRRIVHVDAPVMVAVCVAFILVCLDGLISRPEAGGMVACLLVYLWVLLSQDRKAAPPVEERGEPVVIWQAVAGIAAGLALLIFGADMLIDGATSVARSYGVSERVIGLTLVALGTSLPELAASLVAAFREEVDLLMGNIIGSNIFNILAVAGATGLVHPLPVDWSASARDLAVMVAFALAIWVGLWARGAVKRVEGGLLVAGYIAYIAML